MWRVAKPKRSAKRGRGPVVLTDPRAIKALAHPARLAVLDELFAGRSLTATECADIADLSPSAMSYHLRALQKWGIVERAEASGDGRERPWRAAGEGLRVESAEPRASAVAESALMGRLLDSTRSEVLDWVGNEQAASPWREIGTVASGSRWMTDAEARDVVAEFDAVLEKYRRLSPRERPEGARRVRLSFVLVPNDSSD